MYTRLCFRCVPCFVDQILRQDLIDKKRGDGEKSEVYDLFLCQNCRANGIIFPFDLEVL